MSENYRILSLSPNNLKASSYYQALKNFRSARSELQRYEKHPEFVNSSKLESARKNCDSWEKMVQEKSREAERYEKRLMQQTEQAQFQKKQEQKVGIPGVQRHIDYMA